MALRVIKLTGAQVIGKQLLRSGTSVAANYRAVARHRSDADKINKLGIVVEEADETLFWLELLVEAEIVQHPKLSDLMNEFEEILKMLSTSLHKLKIKK